MCGTLGRPTPFDGIPPRGNPQLPRVRLLVTIRASITDFVSLRRIFSLIGPCKSRLFVAILNGDHANANFMLTCSTAARMTAPRSSLVGFQKWLFSSKEREIVFGHTHTSCIGRESREHPKCTHVLELGWRNPLWFICPISSVFRLAVRVSQCLSPVIHKRHCMTKLSYLLKSLNYSSNVIKADQIATCLPQVRRVSLAPAALALRSPSVHGPSQFSWSNSQANPSASPSTSSVLFFPPTVFFCACTNRNVLCVFVGFLQTFPQVLSAPRWNFLRCLLLPCPSSHASSAPPSRIFRQLVSVFHDPERICKSCKRSVVLEETVRLFRILCSS